MWVNPAERRKSARAPGNAVRHNGHHKNKSAIDKWKPFLDIAVEGDAPAAGIWRAVRKAQGKYAVEEIYGELAETLAFLGNAYRDRETMLSGCSKVRKHLMDSTTNLRFKGMMVYSVLGNKALAFPGMNMNVYLFSADAINSEQRLGSVVRLGYEPVEPKSSGVFLDLLQKFNKTVHAGHVYTNNALDSLWDTLEGAKKSATGRVAWIDEIMGMAGSREGFAQMRQRLDSALSCGYGMMGEAVAKAQHGANGKIKDHLAGDDFLTQWRVRTVDMNGNLIILNGKPANILTLLLHNERQIYGALNNLRKLLEAGLKAEKGGS